MNVKNLFKNLLHDAETLSSEAEQNAVAKAWESTSYSTYSGTASFSIESYRCYKAGDLLFMFCKGTTTSQMTNAMTMPLVKIPITVRQMLVGAAVVGGTNYPLVNTVTSGGSQWMAQGIASTVPSNTAIYLWAVYLIGELGGVTKLLTYLSSLLNRKAVMA